MASILHTLEPLCGDVDLTLKLPRVAVQTLETPKDIKQFFEEYMVYLRDEMHVRKFRTEALNTLGYILQHEALEIVRRRWVRAVPGLREPSLGYYYRR